MAVALNEELLRFVQEVFLAIVGTKRRDGTVQMNPVWFEYHDGSFWLNSWQGSHWMAHIERDRDVTLLLLDPHESYRWAQVQGRLVAATTEGADEHINRLSQRYTGNPVYQYRNRRPGMQRVMLQIEPLRITGPLAG